MEGFYFSYLLCFICSICSGNYEASERILQHCLEQSPSYAEAHFLMAQVHLLQNNFQLCAQSLELCLSYNFQASRMSLY